MKKLLVANWKENPETEREAVSLFDATARAAAHSKSHIIVCPPFIYLERIGGKIKNKKNLSLGAQDVFWEENGSHTGEIGPRMIKQFGARYAIIGHSERRWMGETDDMINQKVVRTLSAGLYVILCVGESALVRRGGSAIARRFVATQLRKDLKSVSSRNPRFMKRLIIAYEPVWAIGTGRNDPPEDVIAMAMSIKREIVKICHLPKGTSPPPVLYGGSVNAKDIMDYLQSEAIDGALVGGASLRANEFKTMIAIVNDRNKT